MRQILPFKTPSNHQEINGIQGEQQVSAHGGFLLVKRENIAAITFHTENLLLTTFSVWGFGELCSQSSTAY